MEHSKSIADVINLVKTYIHEENNLNLIYNAYHVALEKHEGQFRKSGEPYVQHPIEVAYILAGLHTSPSTIAAGICLALVPPVPVTAFAPLDCCVV